VRRAAALQTAVERDPALRSASGGGGCPRTFTLVCGPTLKVTVPISRQGRNRPAQCLWTLAPLCRIEFFAADLFQRRQIISRKFPQHIRRNMIVSMPEDVADTGYL
jgi:hypothetical protein